MPRAAANTAEAVGPNTVLAPRTAPVPIDAANAPRRSVRVGAAVAVAAAAAAAGCTGGSRGAGCSGAIEDVSDDVMESSASKKCSLVLSSSCRIDASAACSGGLSPGCWFLSAALPDPVLRSGLSRPRDGLGAKRDSAGFAAGVGVWLGCCSGGISITNSAFVDRAGWEALAEGIFVTACPRWGGKGGVLPPGLAGLLTCGVDGRHIVRRTHGVASLDCSAGVAVGRATHRSTRQRAPRAARRHGLAHVPSSTVRANTVRITQRAIEVLRRALALMANLCDMRHRRQ